MSDPNENIKNVDMSTETELPETDDLIKRLKAAILPNCDTVDPDAAGKIIKEIMLKSDEGLLAEALRICGGTDPGKNVFASTDRSEVTDVVWGDLFLVYPLQIKKAVEKLLGGSKDENFEYDENFDEDYEPSDTEEDECTALLAAIRDVYYDDTVFYVLSEAVKAAIIGGKKADNEEE